MKSATTQTPVRVEVEPTASSAINDPNWAAFLRRVAHELLSPMTTLRLTLQIGRGRLMRGQAVELATLERALAQVDELSARIKYFCVAPEQAPQADGPAALADELESKLEPVGTARGR